MGSYSIKIKELPASERPRERLQSVGAQNLRDSELLAILLRTGTAQDSALSLASKLLSYYEGDLAALSRVSLSALSGSLKGIGNAKAAQIVAAFELGRRSSLAGNEKDHPILDSPEIVHQILAPSLSGLQHEEFWILMLNNKGRFMGKRKITSGTANHTVVEPMDVFRPAINEAASAIILAHNHPGGDLEPSEDDLDITEKLVAAGNSLEIQVMDHVIISHSGFHSLLENGQFPNP